MSIILFTEFIIYAKDKNCHGPGYDRTASVESPIECYNNCKDYNKFVFRREHPDEVNCWCMNEAEGPCTLRTNWPGYEFDIYISVCK